MGRKMYAPWEKRVCLDSTHVVDSVKSTLILIDGHCKRRPRFLLGGVQGKNNVNPVFLDTTQLFQMPTTGLGYLTERRTRTHIFVEGKTPQLNVFSVLASGVSVNVIKRVYSLW